MSRGSTGTPTHGCLCCDYTGQKSDLGLALGCFESELAWTLGNPDTIPRPSMETPGSLVTFYQEVRSPLGHMLPVYIVLFVRNSFEEGSEKKI